MDSNTNAEQTSNPEAETSNVSLSAEDIVKLVSKTVNIALSEREKRAEKRAAKEAQTQEVQDDSEASRGKRMQAQLDALMKERDEAKAALKESKLMDQVNAVLKGKAAAGWEDVAAEHLRRHVTIDRDEITARIDGRELYTLEDAASAFLEKNPRFKAAKAKPAVVVNQNQQPQLNTNPSAEPSLADIHSYLGATALGALNGN